MKSFEEETHYSSSTFSSSPSPSHQSHSQSPRMFVNQDEPPPLDDKQEEEEEQVAVKVEEEKQSISETPPPSPSLSPMIIFHSPSLLFHSPSPPSDSPTHSTHRTYHTHAFKVTPSDTKPASPPAVPAPSYRTQEGFGAGGLKEDGEESGGGGGAATGGGSGGGGIKIPTLRPNISILKRSRRKKMLMRASLGLRISGFVFCLMSFSVMAADKYKGWALDSFHRYKEFRYCLAVNVIGFLYSGLQTYALTYFFTSGKHIMQHHLRYYFDFLMDQILTYLLISTSSSAAIRVDDWESNWGKDKFPDMARASVALSFLAFVAFASSSLISGYTLFTLKSM